MAEHDDAEDRVLDATPRRRQEARERGQVALSAELVVALLLAGWVAALALGGGPLAATLAGGIAYAAENVGSQALADLTPQSALTHVTAAALPAAKAVLLLVLPILALGVLVGYGQVGFQFAPKAIELDPDKISPIQGWKRLFSLRSVVRSGLGLAKIAVIATTIVVVALSQIGGVASLAENELGPALAATGHVALQAVLAAITAMLALSAADFFYQRWQLSRDLRMTKQEAKEEHRQDEGDPHVKGRIRRLQRELATRRMMADVPKATVIVTNPTHYAVALRYERDGADAGSGGASSAPRVVAKGVDLVAQRIKEVGRDAGVPLYEDVPLARALHARCEIGDEIPADLFTAVAEVLAYVYRVQEAGRPA